MILIIGLGNPGPKYETTRHNFGFLALDHFADKHKFNISQSKFKALYAKQTFKNQDIVLIKPQTFMNLSGQAIQHFSHFYKVLPKSILVLHDEIDLEFGDIRIKHQGGSAGHNGLKSVAECLGSDAFHRIRLGVGRPQAPSQQDVADYVLSPFDDAQLKRLPGLFDQTCQLIEKTIAELS